MKRILCTRMVLIVLLTACSAPAQIPEPSTEQGAKATHGIYELTFTVERLSGWPFGGWNIVYTYNGEAIKSGHRILYSLELFSFLPIRVNVTERDAPENKYSAAFPVGICDGATGKTEVTVTDSDGRTATFKITCQVKQVGKQ